MSDIHLTLACEDYDRTRALRDGRVKPDGIQLNYLVLPVEEIFWRMLRYEVIPHDSTLNQMIESGEIDALMSPRMPTCFLRGSPRVRRLFPDFKQTEMDYFRRTGIFPIMHAIVIRKGVCEENPWAAQSL